MNKQALDMNHYDIWQPEERLGLVNLEAQLTAQSRLTVPAGKKPWSPVLV